MAGQSAAAVAPMRELPGAVWALGVVSLCMDLSSELAHSVLPLLVTAVLGAGAGALGVIEGLAEATAMALKVLSGALSDRVPRRKPLVLLGYGLAAASKPLFPLATSIPLVLGARVADRIGKGIRGAPRDALIADVTPPRLRGAAYGLRQALDSVGAVLGPLAAMALMAALASDIRTVLWAAVVPAAAAVLVLWLGVREPATRRAAEPVRPTVERAALRRLGVRYWLVVGLAAVLMLARFSEAFLVLRAHDLGLPLALAPLVLVVMNAAYTVAAYPAGIAFDRGHGRALLLLGGTALVASDIALALAASTAVLLAGGALWGLHLGLTQGLLSAMVASAAPHDRRGTAFGVYHLVSGAALLTASVVAGQVWQAFGANVTFWVGAGFASLAMLGLSRLGANAARNSAVHGGR